MIRGLVLGDLGRQSEAGKLLKHAYHRLCAVAGERHGQTLSCLNNLADWHYRENEVQEAERLFRRALELSREVYGPRSQFVAKVTGNLGYLLALSGRSEEAVAVLEESVSLFVDLLGAEHAASLDPHKLLAVVLKRLKRWPQARAQLEIVVPAMERHRAPPRDQAEFLLHLGEEQARDREYEAAVRSLGRAATLLDTYTPPLVLHTAMVLLFWANVEAWREDFSAARDVLSRLEDTLTTAPEWDADAVSEWSAKLEDHWRWIDALEQESER